VCRSACPATDQGPTGPTGKCTSLEYRIRRAGHNNWLKNKWRDRDWTEALRQQIAIAQVWSQKHAEFEQVLWHSGVPYPPQHWRDFIAWIRHGTIDDYRKRKAAHIANGIPEIEAAHRAADEAVTELANKTRQRRRVERDTLLGVGGHEELIRRYRGNARLTDAHSRRIAKKLMQVGRWSEMERALREVGYAEPDIERMMGELMGVFDREQRRGTSAVEKDEVRSFEKAI